MRSIDPDSEEAQAASRQNDREVFALQMQAKQDAKHRNALVVIGPGICDACGEQSDELLVINSAPTAGLCACKDCSGDSWPEPEPAISAASPLCRVGHVVWNRHDLGLDGRCKRCGAGFGKERG